MPDPRGGTRLLPFDCEVKFKRTNMKIPMKIEDPSDYIPGTKKARIVEKKIWLVEISMPKSLMSDIRTGSIDLEDQEVDLSDLDAAYDDSHTESSAAPGANALTDPATNAAPAPEQELGM
jgi:hypothetical protein